MTRSTLEGMARAAWETPFCSIPFNWKNASDTERKHSMEGMKAALLYLAANVTPAMIDAFCTVYMEQEHSDWRAGISAAICAAAVGEA